MTDVTFVAIDCDNTVVVIFDGAFVVNDGGDLVVVVGDLVFDVANTDDAPDDIVIFGDIVETKEKSTWFGGNDYALFNQEGR